MTNVVPTEAFPGGARQYTDRELLIIIGEKVQSALTRMERIEERLNTGDRRFADMDRALRDADHMIVDYRNDALRATAALGSVVDAIAKRNDERIAGQQSQVDALRADVRSRSDATTLIVDKIDERVEVIEEKSVIDGDDGKPVSLREMFIREQRKRIKSERILGTLAVFMPIIVLIVDRLLK